jgi:hypothetical protein
MIRLGNRIPLPFRLVTMRNRWIAVLAVLAVIVVACDGDDAELTTDSTIVTGPTSTEPPADGVTTTTPGDDGEATPTSLVGEEVSEYQVFEEIPNDNGVEWIVVIPNGAYTDVDLENFVIDLIEENPNLYGAQIFDDEAAAAAFLVEEAERTDEQADLLERHWFVTLTERARIDFRGPFAEFPGGAIGS